MSDTYFSAAVTPVRRSVRTNAAWVTAAVRTDAICACPLAAESACRLV